MIIKKVTKKTNHYIDNKKFYESVVNYKESIIKAEELSLNQKPRISNYIGQCFQLIAENMAKRPNFSSYSYIDEMKEDGIMNCVKYIDSFDHIKYNNPFAYFSQIIFFAFVQRILTEKKEQYFKYKLLENYLIEEQLNGSSVDSSHIDNDMTDNIIKNFEEYLSKKKQKTNVKKNKGIETFIND